MKRFRVVMTPGARSLYGSGHDGDFDAASFFDRHAPGKKRHDLTVSADRIESIEIVDDGLAGVQGDPGNLFSVEPEDVAETAEAPPTTDAATGSIQDEVGSEPKGG